MVLLSYDIESTGLDKQKDRIIEVGLALYSTGQQKILESTGFLVQSDGVPITSEITEITGITQAAVDRFGYPPEEALIALSDFMEHADAMIGHNVIRFDKPFTENTAKRQGFLLEERLWIDTMTDVPGVKGEQLITMCAKHGFVNPNQHSAEDDAKAVLKLIQSYDIDKIIERAKSPTVVIRSHQPNTPENNRVVGKLGFRWNGIFKIWWRATKEMDVSDIAAKCPFDVSRVDKEVTLEQLDN
jgi:DNA polymerase III alpha subunit (gram-positive type)